MLFSLSWITEYVEHGLSASAVADLLTMSGLEVEEVRPLAPAPAGVVVGLVVETRPHPGADRLTLCTVDLGPALSPDGPVSIVCGAPNVAPGQKVAVATVGTVLQLPSRDDPERREPVTIKRSSIRGEESNGMICAEDELALGNDHSGIVVLDPSAVVGESFADYRIRRGDDDVVLDVSITPNRSDALSYVGVAREIAALTGRPLRAPDVLVPEPGGEAAGAVSIEVEDAEGCGRYVGMIVRGVTVGASPAWLRDRLEAVGARSINNVVDVTNYVMRELGQPLHAFDLARVAGRRIVVRGAGACETLTTLDGTERKIPQGTLLICDGDGPVAIAGVMGGAASEVSAGTSDVLIESAWFDPVRVRRGARALDMSTDASYRFERGVDPTVQAIAAARAAALIVEVAGGAIVPGMAEDAPRPHQPRTVLLRPARMGRLLGTRVPADEAARLLRAVGFHVEEAPALDAFAGELMRTESLEAAEHAADVAGLHLTVPGFKPDVTREVDVIEEVARLWGYDRIPDPAFDAVPLQPPAHRREEERRESVVRRLVGLGFREVYTNSLIGDETAVLFAGADVTGVDASPVRTLNPVSQDMAVLRPSLLPRLLETVSYNQARGARDLRFFEVGHVYRRGEDGLIEGYHEHTSLALAFAGAAAAGGWDAPPRDVDFYDLKGALLHAISALDLPEVTEAAGAGGRVFAENLVLEADGVRLGIIGRVAPALAERLDLRGDVFVAEIDADLLVSLDRRDGQARYAPVSPFPTVERDLAVVVDETVPVGPLLASVRDAGGPLVQSVRIFDLYRGERIEAGLKSVAFSIRLGADRTLTEAEIDGRMRRIVAALESRHGARLRQ